MSPTQQMEGSGTSGERAFKRINEYNKQRFRADKLTNDPIVIIWISTQRLLDILE